jgi:hypothetical protein
MRVRSNLGAICILVSLFVTGTATSQPGSVLHEQKISDAMESFTGLLGSSDECGGAVASLGDLDGAGPSVVALAVGVIGDDDGGGNRGAVYVLFLHATGNVLSHHKISDTQGNFTATLDNSDEFGASIAFLGDLDGAGPSVAAMAVGAAADDDGGSNRGAVYILFLDATGNVLSHQKISDTQGGFSAVLSSSDEFGGAVAYLGDLDGAGPSAAALAVGAVGDDDGGTNHGSVHVLFLNAAGSVLSHQKISDTEGDFAATLDLADEFGSAVASLGDLDGSGDAVAALAVGAVGDDDGGSDRGAVYVLFMNSSGSVLSHQKISESAGNFGVSLSGGDEFGGAVASLGDVDGAGPSVATLAVGTIGDDDGGSNRGAVYVLFLDSTGEVLSQQKISSTSGSLVGPIDDDDEFGGSLASIGDVDGSGESVVALASGAVLDDDGGSDYGAVHVLFLAGVSVSDAARLPAARGSTLGQAWPNPFNPTTTIPFAIAESAWVEIDIWDVHGRLVRKLVRARFTPGDYAATWDGQDDSGRPLASGTYYYRMSVDGRAVPVGERAVLLK